jgi:hypothetical protein
MANEQKYFYPYCRQATGFCSSDDINEKECNKPNAHITCGHYHSCHPVTNVEPIMLGEIDDHYWDDEAGW